jgi:hypothetical protein
MKTIEYKGHGITKLKLRGFHRVVIFDLSSKAIRRSISGNDMPTLVQEAKSTVDNLVTATN